VIAADEKVVQADINAWPGDETPYFALGNACQKLSDDATHSNKQAAHRTAKQWRTPGTWRASSRSG
jgi:hypothetical protein